MDAFRTLFQKHPSEVGETYWVHAKEALRIAAYMFAGGAAATVHAFFPFLFTTTASQLAARVASSKAAREQKNSK